MENIFYIRIPGETFYDNPYEKSSIGYRFNLSKKTITVERRAIAENGFRTSEKIYPLSEEDAASIMRVFTCKDGFLLDYIKEYAPADGKRFAHCVLGVGPYKVNFPDYLCNFKGMDVFKRYRYYPEPERVLFYSMIRYILHIAFEKTERPRREFPTSTKSSLAFKIDADSLTLE